MKTNKIIKRRHWANFDIAGFSYWDGCLVLNELRPGMELRLKREEDNRFDHYAVAIYYGDSKLGFVPRGENHELSKLLEMGYADILEARVQRVAPEERAESQVSVIIYLKYNDKQIAGKDE